MNLIKHDIATEIINRLEINTVGGEIFAVILPFLINLVVALIVLFIGRKLIKLILKIVKKICTRAQLDKSVTGFLQSTIKVMLYVALIIGLAEIIGLPTTSFIAILGSAGLAVGLALQGSLSNFAGGVLILILRPFKVGDVIAVGANEGTVTSIDVFYTRLRTADDKVVIMPNGSLSNSNVILKNNESK